MNQNSTETPKEDIPEEKETDDNEGEKKTTTKKSSTPNTIIIIVCSNCETLQTETHKLIRCPCHSVRYCNKDCQKKHRTQHKKECRRLLAEKKMKKTKQITAKPPQEEEQEQGERKEHNATETTTNDQEEERDECPICLEMIPKIDAYFTRFVCCGNGLHDHCAEDLKSTKIGDNCPLCRAKAPTTKKETIKQLRPWVKKKIAWAQALIAGKYDRGEGVKQSYGTARKYYDLAAQQGNIGSMFNLGKLYHYGFGVEQSYDRAFEYYEQAADLGLADAQFLTGIMYIMGTGVERSPMKARELLVKSAAQGDENAIKALKQLDQEEGRTTTMSSSDHNAIAIVCSHCDTPQTESHRLIRCPCHSVRYCNKVCQKRHRKKHKKECRRLLAEKKLKKWRRDCMN